MLFSLTITVELHTRLEIINNYENHLPSDESKYLLCTSILPKHRPINFITYSQTNVPSRLFFNFSLNLCENLIFNFHYITQK